ncbi:hypothetical protein ACFQV4_23035 [Streptomyces thermocarboxydus]
MIVRGIQAIADGRAPSDPLNEEWDKLVLDTFRSGDLTPADGWENGWFVAEGGSAAHEMRSWIAAYAALSTAAPTASPSTATGRSRSGARASPCRRR